MPAYMDLHASLVTRLGWLPPSVLLPLGAVEPANLLQSDANASPIVDKVPRGISRARLATTSRFTLLSAEFSAFGVGAPVPTSYRQHNRTPCVPRPALVRTPTVPKPQAQLVSGLVSNPPSRQFRFAVQPS